MFSESAKPLGKSGEHNPYSAELQAASEALTNLGRTSPEASPNIVLVTANLGLLQALSSPGRQSGQEDICKIYAVKRLVVAQGGSISGLWIRSTAGGSLRGRAKKGASKAAIEGRGVKARELPLKGTGSASNEVDRALPGPHTKTIYNGLSKEEAKTLAQLRTGHNRLNPFLARIGAAESAECECGAAVETVRHFLFGCRRWLEQRRRMCHKWPDREGNVSFFLGGKGILDKQDWAPQMEAVRATIRYARDTGRLAAPEA